MPQQRQGLDQMNSFLMELRGWVQYSAEKRGRQRACCFHTPTSILSLWKASAFPKALPAFRKKCMNFGREAPWPRFS